MSGDTNEKKVNLLESIVNCKKEWYLKVKDTLASFVTFDDVKASSDAVQAISFVKLTKEQLKRVIATLSIFTAVSSITLQSCPFEEQHIIDLSSAIKSNSSIKRLDLSNSKMDAKTVEKLCEFLGELNKVERLTLKNINLTPINTKNLSTALKKIHHNSQLSRINLSHNQLGYEGLKNLIESLSSLTNLHIINISNTNLDSQCLPLLAKLLELSKNLESILLNNNKLSDNAEGVKNLINAAINLKDLISISMDCNSLLSTDFYEMIPLFRSDNSIRSVHLAGNCISDGILQICPLLEKGQIFLRSLDFSANHIPEYAFRILADSLKNIPENFNLELILGNNLISPSIASLLLTSLAKKKTKLRICLENRPLKAGHSNDINPNRFTKK